MTYSKLLVKNCLC